MQFLPLLICQLLLSYAVLCQELFYSMPEESERGYPVGNVLLDGGFQSRFSGSIPADLRFSLLKRSPYFDVNSVQGTISSLEKVDREAVCPDNTQDDCTISIDVTVMPMQYLRIFKIHIKIMDINDNSPLFPKPGFDLLIPENVAVNTTFELPTAVDRDSKKYGVVSYDLETNTQVFGVIVREGIMGDLDLHLVVLQQLDRERLGSYTLKLVARDGGQPSRSGMIILNITVGDENDNSPIFQQTLYSVRVPESALPGIMLTKVKATDRDIRNNGLVKYYINPRSSTKVKSYFSIDEHSGEFILRQKLDYETDKAFLVHIIASDSGIIPLSSQAIINVTITDENDNAPHITITTVGTKAQVRENSPNGTFVAHVKVEDMDSDANGLVTCLVSSPYFVLKPSYENEYNLVSNVALDREIEQQLNVTILCSDSGSPPKFSREFLIVDVEDVNDNKPQFEKYVYYTMPIQENNEPGIPIIQVKATDRDSGNNAEITYQLSTDIDANYFAINRVTGLITANTVLDRETQKEYTFSVLAIDKGEPALTGTAAVYVRLADVNDNAPAFNVSYYRMSVAENMPKYSFVGKVTALDPDEGNNGDIWYRMVDASNNLFIIAHDTGIISTRAPLDREKVGGTQYQVTVVATDYGTPALSSEVKVTIDIIDENDHRPIITSAADNQTVKCSYLTPVNTTIAVVVAFDPDANDNGKLGYFIHSGNANNIFAIDKQSGEVKVAGLIDESMIGYHKLEIGVHDNGLPPHTVFTELFIRVTKEAYVPASQLIGDDREELSSPKTYNVNLIVVVVLSSMSGILSLILIVAIIRIKRQTKENHSYNCRAEAQKLFAKHNRNQSSSSSWVEKNSSFSRESLLNSQNQDHMSEPITKNFLTTFSNSNINPAKCMAQEYDGQMLERTQLCIEKCNIQQQERLNSLAKEGDTDSGNGEDACSIHNSTPMLPVIPNTNKYKSASSLLNKQQSFQTRFLTTGGEGTASNGPSSISSGNNSISTDTSSQMHTNNSNDNENHQLPDNNYLAKKGTCRHPLPGVSTEESSTDCMPNSTTSLTSDQTINGYRLCERIEEMFFSDVV